MITISSNGITGRDSNPRRRHTGHPLSGMSAPWRLTTGSARSPSSARTQEGLRCGPVIAPNGGSARVTLGEDDYGA
jgi:hypothetical protein